MSVESDFLKLASDVVEMELTHLWDGYDGTVFMEFGTLSEFFYEDRKKGNNPKGEVSVGFEWNWTFQLSDDELYTSEDSEEIWLPVLKNMVGEKLVGFELAGTPPELEIKFLNGSRIKSYMDEDDDDPTWMILDNRSQAADGFEVKSGKLTY